MNFMLKLLVTFSGRDKPSRQSGRKRIDGGLVPAYALPHAAKCQEIRAFFGLE